MPLRWKLVGTYAVVLAIVIGGFSVALVSALRSTLESGAAAEVEAGTRGLGAVVEFEGGAWVIEAKTGIDQQYSRDSGRYYRIAEAHGEVLLASPLARELPLGTTAGQRIWQQGGRRFLELTLAVDKKGDEDEPVRPTTLLVTSGRDLHDVDVAVTSLLQLLAWLGPLVLLLSLGGGLFLASRALAPIDRIARTAAAIGANDLHQRIAVRGRDELAMLATTLNATFDRLQLAFERQQRFTADAAHELRTPLAVMQGNLELALSRARSREELEDLLREIAAAAQQMQELTEGLLALARTDGVGLGREAVTLLPLCQEVVRREGAAAKGIDVACGGDATVTVRGDAACLQQLLSNLIRNGVRYNENGGHVRVRVSSADGMAQIEVEDDGIGIPAAALPRLGERFFRVDASRTRSTGGVGLGLSIAKAIVQAHGGEMRFDSVEGEGTKVAVTLPLA